MSSYWAPKPLDKGTDPTPLFTENKSYRVIVPQVAKEDLHLSKSLQKAEPELMADETAPKFDPKMVKAIIEMFMKL